MTSYQLPSNTVHKISLKGNKLLSTEDIKANISGLKESNKSFLFIRLNSYLNRKRFKKDSLGIKQSSLQFFKRAPSLVDTNEIANIQGNLLTFYRKNGFLRPQLTVQISNKNEKKSIEYKISEGQQSVFSTQDSLIVDNPQIATSLASYMETKSLIKKGNALSINLINQQKDALTNYFRNKGYFYFNPEVIGIHLNDLKDTTLSKVNLVYKIPALNYVNSESRRYDQVFRFGTLKIDETSLNQADESSTWVKKSINSNQLKRIINFKEGDLYSLEKVNQSLLNIYATDQFKTVNLTFDTSATKVYPKIELVKNNKYTFSSEVGGSVFRGIPGPFISNSFKIRQVFSYLDYLDFTGRIGFEAQTGFINTETTRKNLEFNLSSTLNLPSLFIPKKFDRWKTNLTASQTQVGLGFDYIDRPEYSRTNLRLFQRYNWRKSTNKYFQLSLVDLNLLNTNYPSTPTSTAFIDYLEELRLQGNNLYRSFNPSFVSSINFQYNYRSFIPTNILNNGQSLLINLESGGTSLNLLQNKKLAFIENMFGQNQEILFYRYLRMNFDYRKYRMLGKRLKSQLAFKLNAGIAYAYGTENNFELPYEKNFFIGGPSSIRAWKPRRLGPGGYNASSNLIEQPGSMIIESSIEYRFPIIQFLGKINGALFIDAGNIWNINHGQGNNVGYFNVNTFLNEIAVGTGFGVRWDFDYFLLRLDLASKAINPAYTSKEKWVLPKTSFSSGENPIEFNIGIGYPF
ncbi:BamA/TamA family outer membrane protein [Aquirufa sp.]|uniref:translocation and assembly module lipoprotein TamL n=1 Tax=Aquirufa sp. TaxID=2676249 RepID=UPI0037BE9623